MRVDYCTNKFGGGKEPRYHPRAKSRHEKEHKRMDNRLMKGCCKQRKIRGGLEPSPNPTLQRCDEKEQHGENGNKLSNDQIEDKTNNNIPIFVLVYVRSVRDGNPIL